MTRYIFPLLSPSYVEKKNPTDGCLHTYIHLLKSEKLSTYAPPHAPLQASRVGRCLPKHPLKSLADCSFITCSALLSHSLPMLLRANHVSLPPIIQMGLGSMKRICQKRHATYPCYIARVPYARHEPSVSASLRGKISAWGLFQG